MLVIFCIFGVRVNTRNNFYSDPKLFWQDGDGFDLNLIGGVRQLYNLER